jgi:hypothetical protein
MLGSDETYVVMTVLGKYSSGVVLDMIQKQIIAIDFESIQDW